MAGERWSFEPLDLAQFPLGEGPFRVRGLAYIAALAYVDRRLPGGRAGLAELLATDPYLPYFDHIFVPPGTYDVSPLLALHRHAAKLEGVPVGRFIEERSRASATHDARGLWKPLLSGNSLRVMAERLPLAFNRYYEPSQARVLSATDNGFDGELTQIAEQMSGLYTNSTAGFVSAALELAGAQNVSLRWESPQRETSHHGISTCKVRFSARWR